MQLDLTEASFLMFRNAGSGGINLVYRRADGHIGWIDADLPKAGAANGVQTRGKQGKSRSWATECCRLLSIVGALVGAVGRYRNSSRLPNRGQGDHDDAWILAICSPGTASFPRSRRTTRSRPCRRLQARPQRVTGLPRMISSQRCCSASGSARQGSAAASPSRTSSCRASTPSSACSPASSTPIAFESHDGEPVDLVFFLLAPEHAGGDHLKALARISRLVREPAALEHLRTATDATALRSALTAPVASHAA